MGRVAGRRTQETCRTRGYCIPGLDPSSLHPAAWIPMDQLCPPSCWLPVWHSCLLSRQPLTQVLMTVSCSPDRQRGSLPELCHHLKEQTSSNQQDCRYAVSGQLVLSASFSLRCSGDWEHNRLQTPSVAGMKRGSSWEHPNLRNHLS